MTVQFLKRPDRPDIAFKHSILAQTALPTVVFLGGFRSDMEGNKAQWLDYYCQSRGQPYLRFDYSGHGMSGGLFEDQTISLWAQDALCVIKKCVSGPLILIGSSMGGWISLLIAPQLEDRLFGLIGVAAAPDFSVDIRAEMTSKNHQDLTQSNYFVIPNGYSSQPYKITRTFLDDGDTCCVLRKKNTLKTKLRLLHGQQDEDVDWQKALLIRQSYPLCDTRIIFIDDGDHRLSRSGDLGILGAMIEDLSSGGV